MMGERVAIALVSGKGGVGKTMLAANLAWVCSQVARTVLVDLDFQNQGATGLFAPHVTFTSANALDALKALDNPELRTPVEVAPPAPIGARRKGARSCGLSFLPSSLWGEATRHEQIAEFVESPDFVERIHRFVDLMHGEGFDIVVLDCHGGVDPVSLAAFENCDHTLMITEADGVTFNGTLELIDYYRNASNEQSTVASRPAAVSATEGMADGRTGHIRLVVNRLSSKYRWADLERIYGTFMKTTLGSFSADQGVFCYVPVEESLAETFGEYPFYVKLAPKSIYSQKVRYMVWDLLGSRFNLDTPVLARFRKPRYRRKVERVLASHEHKNIQAILKSFAWFSTGYAVGIILFIGYEIQKLLSGTPVDEFDFDQSPVLFSIAIVFGVAVGIPLILYSTRALFGLMFLYRDKHRFQKALFKSVSPRLTMWQRVSLLKLLVLRIGTSVIPLFLVVYVVILAVGGITVLVLDP